MTKYPLHFALLFETAAQIVEHVGWTQGEFARDVHGKAVSYASKKAVCFCAEGALHVARSQAGWKYSHAEVLHAMEDIGLFYQTGPGFLHRFNDNVDTSSEDVAEAFYLTAAAIRGQHE